MEQEGAVCSYFLSYSRADERFALRFAKDLRAAGVAMWVDQLDIRPSEHWDRAIERAVRDCRGLVVILSPRSVASDNVADEISYAIDSRKPVLPVMIEKCTLPLRITRMHLIDATGSYERALQQCIAEIKRADGAPPPAIAAPAPAALDPEIIAAAKRQLTSIIGPIAGVIVHKEASRAGSAEELHSLLGTHIEDERDRERFVALMSRPEAPRTAAKTLKTPPPAVAQTSISPADVQRLADVLMSYLGPIAPVVARRESKKSESIEDFEERLAALIPSDRDRADFVKRLQMP